MLRLNANYPGQQVEPATALEWYGPLSGFSAQEVWAALERHRQDLTKGQDGRPRGAWLPSLAEILDGVDVNWREESAARRRLEASARRNAGGGVPMPPETREAIGLLHRSTFAPGVAGRLERSVARQRIEVLADQLAERFDREQEGRL